MTPPTNTHLVKQLAFIGIAGALMSQTSTSLADNAIAFQIDPYNQHQVPAGGLDAIGGRGDWFLSNGELCGIVSDSSHQTYLSLHGGVLVDLWHCSLGNDQWATHHPQFNLDKEQIPKTTHIVAHSDTQSAALTVEAQAQGIQLKTRYQLSDSNPHSLLVTTELQRLQEGLPLNLFGGVTLHPRGALAPFTIDSTQQEFSRGFKQPLVDTTKQGDIISTVAVADLQVLVGSRHLSPGISYGIRQIDAYKVDDEGQKEQLKAFLMSGESFTLNGFFSEAFWDFSRKPSIYSFIRGQFMDLAIGEKLVIEQEILVGDKADVATITDQIYTGATLWGRLDTADAGITVSGISNPEYGEQQFSFVRPDKQGNFELRLPAHIQSVELNIQTPWGTTQKHIVIDKERVNTGYMTTGGMATIKLPRGEPMTLTFVPVDGSPTPIFSDELTGLSVGDKRVMSGSMSHHLSLSGSRHDPRSVTLAPGKYQVFASRGIEFDINQASIEVAAGETEDLNIAAPLRAVNSQGLVSADFHVHSGVGFDSSLAPKQRVIDFVAQGAEILVPTEHNISYDLQPVIDELRLNHQVITFPGVELTSMIHSSAAPHSTGHSNVFPISANEHQFMGGTISIENKRLGHLIHDYKTTYPDSIFQLNHPRLQAYDSDIAYFNHLSQGDSYDPTKPIHQPPNLSLVEPLSGSSYRDIDFDAIELLSGEAMDSYELVRQDWFSLLNQGIYKVATANSDSHASAHLVAMPRTYLLVDNDQLEHITPDVVVRAIKNGKVFGTTGPLLRVALGATLPGDTHHGNSGTLTIRADAPDWIDASSARIFINGTLYKTLAIDKGQAVEEELAFDNDSYITVEVSGKASDEYRLIAPGFTPFAFSNPIFVAVPSQ